MATVRSAIKSFLRRHWTIIGVREYHPADFTNCACKRANFAHSDILYVRIQEARMKAMKYVGLALVVFGVAFTTGCERHSNKEVFYMVSSNMALPYWRTAAKGFNKAAAQYKVTAKVVGPENYDPQAELAELQKAVAAKPAGILISVADVSVLGPAIDSAIGAGVPVITIDSDAVGSKRLFFIGTNNLEAGRVDSESCSGKEISWRRLRWFESAPAHKCSMGIINKQ